MDGSTDAQNWLQWVVGILSTAFVAAFGYTHKLIAEARKEATDGETISLWAAMEALHGVWLARGACFLLSVLVEWDHCHKQLLGRPMPGISYARAGALLIGVPTLLLYFVFR